MKSITKRVIPTLLPSALLITALTTIGFIGFPAQSHAASDLYKIDTKGQHAFIQFKINHLGFSWLWGRFNQFDGTFKFDEEHPENSSVQVTIDMNSIDTNHAERDKHLRNKDFFNVKKHPTATFVSKSIERTGEKSAIISGLLTLNGVEKLVQLKTTYTGGGKDPWGGYRQGFEATTDITLADFDISYNLGPASKTAEVIISIEGIRQ